MDCAKAGRLIRTLRLERGLTQAELAEKTGTSPSYVNRLIKRPEKIINNTFVKMMEKLGYDIELTYVKR